MGAWGHASCDNDDTYDAIGGSIMDRAGGIELDESKLEEISKDLNESLDNPWWENPVKWNGKELSEYSEHDHFRYRDNIATKRLGAVIWCLRKGLRIDLKHLLAAKEDIEFNLAYDELLISYTETYKRALHLKTEMEDIDNAISNNGWGTEKKVVPLLEKICNISSMKSRMEKQAQFRKKKEEKVRTLPHIVCEKCGKDYGPAGVGSISRINPYGWGKRIYPLFKEGKTVQEVAEMLHKEWPIAKMIIECYGKVGEKYEPYDANPGKKMARIIRTEEDRKKAEKEREAERKRLDALSDCDEEIDLSYEREFSEFEKISTDLYENYVDLQKINKMREEMGIKRKELPVISYEN